MASVTITTDAGQDARLAPAFGDKLQLGHNATTADVKAYLIADLKAVVQAYEQRIANQAVPPPVDFTPT